MRINTNVAAMNAYRNLVDTDNRLGKSLERLSSGLRINRAADDTAGLAISEKMRGQIRGLNQAVRNAQDGISLIQTAEGALNEAHSILQRMRELAGQSASDTLTASDRSQLQLEVDQLAEELTRISRTTEFNTQNLLDGTFTGKKIHIGANRGQSISLSISNMSATALQVAQEAGTAFAGTVGANDIGITGVSINQATYAAGAGSITIATDYTAEQAAEAATATHAPLTFTAATAGETGNAIRINFIDTGTLTDLGVSVSDNDINVTLGHDGSDVISNWDEVMAAINSHGAAGAMVTVTGGNTDLAAAGTVALGGGANAQDAALEFTATTTGQTDSVVTLTGAAIGSTGTVAFGGDFAGLSVTRSTGVTAAGTATITVTEEEVSAGGISINDRPAADSALNTIDGAIAAVSTQRSELGAMQNRLEHTIANLGVAAENLTAAESRIRDLDMAQEMVAFTRNQIMMQAGTAMLAQANMKPQSVLMLLS